MSKRRYPIDPEEWLNHVVSLRQHSDTSKIQKSLNLYENKNSTFLDKGLGIADILFTLALDNETLAATLVYPGVQAGEISPDAVVECLGEDNYKLLLDVLQMQSLGSLQHLEQRGPHQVENLRKMLLAMVTDVRSVLVVLAERLWQLRKAKDQDVESQKKLANETLAVYAPLANRLGVWHLKWEIEDLCLRYLHPDVYRDIAKSIASRRDDREAYVHHFIKTLNTCIAGAGVKNFQIMGRVKHIYSIYKKMQRKNANLEQIYDMSALRVLVDTIEDCYSVLAILQNGWKQVPEEFDNYISQPKPNGYQSIHMVLVSEDNVFVEVQIRTYQMHQESELGVAAHWRYKEGVLQPSGYESKIILLRQIMAWQKEVVTAGEKQLDKPQPQALDLFEKQIYVFTPQGDILSLPQGATPLDFAYSVHSEVGHRCRGAKVDGHIVPLTYELETGQRVEILTAKQANPSRDWMNPHLKYVKSSRTRAKIQHWFKIKDAAAQPAPVVVPSKKVENLPKAEVEITRQSLTTATPDITISGVDNLLTHVARCCKPLPGEAVMGYVTRNRGVTIHRRDCGNMQNMLVDSAHRKIEVNWGEKKDSTWPADLLMRVYDRPGLLRDVTTMLAGEKINVSGLQTQKVDEMIVDIYLTLELQNRDQLKSALHHLQKLPNVIQVKRR